MPPTPTDALEEGVRLERSGLLDKALQQFRAAESADQPGMVALALRHQADVHRVQCEWDLALEKARRSADVARSAGRDDLLAEALNAEAAVHLSRTAYDEATPLLLRMLQLEPEPRIRGIALQNLGLIAAERGELDEAHRRFIESVACFEAADYTRGVAVALINTSRMPLLRGRYQLAAEDAKRAEQIARQVGDLELVALACLTLGEAMLKLGRLEEAERCSATAFGYFSGVGNDWRRIECFRLQGDVHVAEADIESALRCYRRGIDIARELGATREVERLEERVERAASATPGRASQS